MLLTLFGKECRQTAKSLIFYLILLILVFFYTSQMGALEPFQKPEQGETDSYGMRPSNDPQAIMEATLGMLVTDYEANRYTAYPMGFYKEVILTEEKQEKIHRILTECTGMDSGYEDFVTPPETQQVGDGSFMVVPGSSATVPVADTLTYDRFLELMGQVDELLGGGSSYDPETVNQNAMESMTYEEALEAYEASLTQDKVTRGYARLFCDYMGLMLGLLPVFPAVVRVLRDKRASASQVIYVRSASSASIVLSRWLASICMLLLPVLLLGIMPAWQSVYYGNVLGASPDPLAYVKYTLGWLLPEILVVTALGFFVTELTGGPLAILIQGFWWLASLFSNTNSLVGGVGWNLMPRFNSSQDTAVWLEVFPQMVKNRLFYTVLALMLAAATVWVYHLKRKGVLQNGRKFLGRRKDTL